MRTLARLALLLIGATVAYADAEIIDLHLARQGAGLEISFELVDAFDERMVERLESGLPTEIVYVMRIEKPRRLWFNNSLERSELQIVAMYNAVAREYLVNYKLDGMLIDSRVVQDRSELEQAMSLVSSLEVFQRDRRYPDRAYVKVKAELGSRHVLLLFPSKIETEWTRQMVPDSGAEPVPE